MKYIRVCDEHENEYITTYKQHCKDVANMQDSGFDFEGCIIKQANTIEELCDYVWYKEKHHEPMLERICTNLVSVMKKPRVEGAFEYVRFMILIGKDLKTAAEMNEKGELELL